MTVHIHDSRACRLGEGALWHPTRRQLFWFDILSNTLLSKGAQWAFDGPVSAAGWVDHDTLLIAAETGLLIFDVPTGDVTPLMELGADDPRTRSNDGRADPNGGFWFGTMGKALQPGLGAIYRFYRGQVRRLYAQMTIPNAICFAPSGRRAYFTDTPAQQIMAQELDGDGWPTGDPQIFIDLRPDGLNPDGAVVDADGCLWVAQWGASRVARYGPDGGFLSAHALPASQITCPAFGDGGLYVTSACDGVDEPLGGQTFLIPTTIQGQDEHQVIL